MVVEPSNRYVSVARELLARQVELSSLDAVADSISESARRLGRDGSFSSMQLSHILHGRRMPSLLLAVAIKRCLGIVPADWLREPVAVVSDA